jgi:AcrR family transcriptional regulator
MATAGRTRRDSQARTRADLIAAAREVFLARGFHAATLEEIAERAGYTKGAVYSNFAGKDDLFLALLAEHYAGRVELYSTLVVADGDGDAEGTYRALARLMLAAYEQEPEWWPLVSDFTSHTARQPVLLERLRETRAVFLDALVDMSEALREQHGLTFALPAREVARGVGALMRGMVVEWAIDPSPTHGQTFEEMLAAYLRGLAVPLHERSTA